MTSPCLFSDVKLLQSFSCFRWALRSKRCCEKWDFKLFSTRLPLSLCLCLSLECQTNSALFLSPVCLLQIETNAATPHRAHVNMPQLESARPLRLSSLTFPSCRASLSLPLSPWSRHGGCGGMERRAAQQDETDGEISDWSEDRSLSHFLNPERQTFCYMLWTQSCVSCLLFPGKCFLSLSGSGFIMEPEKHPFTLRRHVCTFGLINMLFVSGTQNKPVLT